MSIGGHARQTPNKGIHPAISWTFADAAARVAFTVTSGIPNNSGDLTSEDVLKFAYQIDDSSIWILTGVGPETWFLVGGVDASAIHTNLPGEINGISTVAPAASDVFVFEDADDSFNKAKNTLGSIAGLGTPATHAESHEDGNSDPITVSDLSAGSSNTYDRLRPAGGTSLEWVRSDDFVDFSSGTSTTSGSTFLTKVSITLPAEDATFFIRASGLVSHSNTTGNPSVRLQNTTDAVTLGRTWECEMQDSDNKVSAVFEWVYNQTAVAGAKTIELQYAVVSGTGTLSISNAFIMARREIS